jgi:hypothetical protein
MTSSTLRSPQQPKTTIFINRSKYELNAPTQTGRSLKELAGIPLKDTLFLDQPHEDQVIANDATVTLRNGAHLHSQPAAEYGGPPGPPTAIRIFINHHKHDLSNPTQTGRALKELDHIPLGDTLFLDRPHEDQVIANDAAVTLENGSQLHSEPPADYGGPALSQVEALPESLRKARVLPQPDGWTFVVFDYPIGDGYRPAKAELLVKLPPQFPDASPDMFWVKPAVVTVAGAAPRGTSSEVLLGESWQRFSWHLKAGAWRAGISDLRDFMRCVRARFERKD